MKKLFSLFLFFLSAIQCMAHIGSSGVTFEGRAGAYAIQAYIQPPDVIPGTAKVTILAQATGIRSVKISPIFYWSGDEGTPTADEALPVAGEAGRFEGILWLMDTGVASVRIEIEGNNGRGTVVIPVIATSTATRTMPKQMGWILALVGLLLLGLLITIIGASTADSLLPVGQVSNARINRKRIVGSVIGACLCVSVVWVGNSWWTAETENYKENMYHPLSGTSTILTINNQQVLNFQIDTISLRKRNLNYIVPDHGKLMHLFLVRQGSLDVMAHLHPTRTDSLTFRAGLPPLPTGKYLVYADIIRFPGFANTIADTLIITEKPSEKKGGIEAYGDAEDTYVVTNPIDATKPVIEDATITQCGSVGVKTTLQDGSTIVWEGKPEKPLMAGNLYSLKFSVESSEGKPAELQPYLGMMGHAVVLRDDGSVYIHLHPTGTFASTSAQIMEKRIAETSARAANFPPSRVFRDSIDQVMTYLKQLPENERDKMYMAAMSHTPNASNHHSMVSFPYAFPKAGRYRLFLQVKRNGKILTGAFEATVK